MNPLLPGPDSEANLEAQRIHEQRASHLHIRAERDKLLGFYTEIVRELGDDLVLKRIRELTARAEAAEAKLAGVRAAVIEACRNAEMKVYVWYPENARSYIHPNQLTEIYKSQVTECLAAIEEVFEPGVLKRLAKNEEKAP